MERRQRDIRVHVDGYTRLCLTMIAMLMTLIVIGLWSDTMPTPEQARAQGIRGKTFIDSSAQRVAAIKEQKITNEKLTELIGLLRSGAVKVQIVEDKNAKKGVRVVGKGK